VIELEKVSLKYLKILSSQDIKVIKLELMESKKKSNNNKLHPEYNYEEANIDSVPLKLSPINCENPVQMDPNLPREDALDKWAFEMYDRGLKKFFEKARDPEIIQMMLENY